MAARSSKKQIFMADFEEAVDRVIAGPNEEPRINPREKEMTAYHEAGHAWSPGPRIRRPSTQDIYSSAWANGWTHGLVPEEDRYLWTKNQFAHRMAVTMGGRVASRLFSTK
ncbi:MAG: hypothetical protein CM1200mP22_02740 [Dehalococcoidia bacterium]|nr:MAG: hypothetical protein CM1200mP22_02740 [Dehalococcoidia bacterium]